MSLSTKGEADVVFKGLITAAAATALAVTPALAAAQTASRTQAVPAAESVRGSALQSDNANSDRGDGVLYNGWIIPFGVFIAIGLGVGVAAGIFKNKNKGKISA